MEEERAERPQQVEEEEEALRREEGKQAAEGTQSKEAEQPATTTAGEGEKAKRKRKKKNKNKNKKQQQQQSGRGGAGEGAASAPQFEEAAYLEWLQRNHVKGLDGLALENDFPVTGRGLKAKQALPKESEILAVPLSLTISLQSAKDSKIGPLLFPCSSSAASSSSSSSASSKNKQQQQVGKSVLSEEDTLALHLLYEKLVEGASSRHHQHLLSMPPAYPLVTVCWPMEEEAKVLLKGSNALTLTQRLAQQIQEDWEQLRASSLFKDNPTVFPPHLFTLEEYRWALCTIWSRSMDFVKLLPAKKQQRRGGGGRGAPPAREPPRQQRVRCIVPFADMLNTRLDAKRDCRHYYEEATGTIRIYSREGYKAGEQVFLDYGVVPNSRLMQLYGFCMPDNPHDTVDIVAAMDPSAENFFHKFDLLATFNIALHSAIPISLQDPVPEKLLMSLRLQYADKDDMDRAQKLRGKYAPLSKSNESTILRALAAALLSMLQAYPDNESKKESDGAEPTSVAAEENASLSPLVQQRKYFAKVLREGEQRIIRAALERIVALRGGSEASGLFFS
ncbi:MYND-type zinc finger protein samB [Balamuthia mandrillaris]